MVSKKTKKLKAYNIRELRELVGLNQEEFAYLSGISAVYLSQIETGNRRLSSDVAEGISRAFKFLFHEIEDNMVTIHNPVESTEIIGNHVASFYSEDLQEKVLRLIRKRKNIDFELNYITAYGEPFPEDKKGRIFDDNFPPPPILRTLTDPGSAKNPEFVKKINQLMEKNKKIVKDTYNKRKKTKFTFEDSHKKTPSFFDDFPIDNRLSGVLFAKK